MAGSPFLSGNYAPVLDERGPEPCRVSGALPAALRGTLFRNGANPRWPPAEPYHWFTGDGMVHAITLADGMASYCNRWVRTPRFVAEAATQAPLFAGFGQPLRPESHGVNAGVANTHVVYHAGRLLALEEAHLPQRLALHGLETLGQEDFGVVAGSFTAHPKHDPATGQLVFFSYSATGLFSTGMTWGTVEPDGRVSHYERFEAPYSSMVHDFAVTGQHVVVPVMPLTGSLERAMSGRPPFAWEGTRQSFFGVIHRGQGAASLRWIAGPPCFAFHVMNAFEAGDELAMDVVEYDAAPLFPHADGSPAGEVASRLARWRISLAEGRVRRETLDDRPGEFPRIDERRAGLPYQHGFRILPAASEAEGDGVAHHDLGRGETRVFTLPPGQRASEAVFVPRAPDAPEADGWLLTVVWRPDSEGSALCVLDTAALGDGPCAEIALPRRVPFGFHGSWVAAEAMAGL